MSTELSIKIEPDDGCIHIYTRATEPQGLIGLGSWELMDTVADMDEVGTALAEEFTHRLVEANREAAEEYDPQPVLIERADLTETENFILGVVTVSNDLNAGQYDLWREPDGSATVCFLGREIYLATGREK